MGNKVTWTEVEKEALVLLWGTNTTDMMLLVTVRAVIFCLSNLFAAVLTHKKNTPTNSKDTVRDIMPLLILNNIYS